MPIIKELVTTYNYYEIYKLDNGFGSVLYNAEPRTFDIGGTLVALSEDEIKKKIDKRLLEKKIYDLQQNEIITKIRF